MTLRNLSKLPLLCSALLMPAIACAQLSLEAFAPSGGGGTSTGGEFTVAGHIGHAAPVVSSGGGFTVEPISWGFISVALPRLNIEINDGVARITWPVSAASWRLEVATIPAENPAAWSPISPPYSTSGSVYMFTEVVSPEAKFYRLRRER